MNFTPPSLDAGFDSLGYAYANDSRPNIDKDTLGCISLWCSVIEMAFRGSVKDLKKWLRTTDFVFIAGLAGISASVLRGAVKRIECGEIAVRPKLGRPTKQEKRLVGQ